MDRAQKLITVFAWMVLAWLWTSSMWLYAELATTSQRHGDATRAEDASLHDVVFVDREYGWAVGEHSAIWHTTDGGLHWQLQRTEPDCGLHGISFVDRHLGWAVGGSTRPYLHTSQAIVLRTTDGGQTWQQELSLLPALEQVEFFDAKRGVAWGRGSGGEPLGVFASDDGGRNWRPFAVGPASAWWGGDFLDRSGGVVVGPQGQLAELKHGDAMPVARTSASDIHAVQFSDDGTGWAVGENGLTMRSDDAGKTWRELNILPEDLQESITWNTVASRGSHVWIAGTPGTVVLHSPDNGKSWQGHSTGQRMPLHKLVFADETHGWAVGDLGTVLHTTDGGQTWQMQRCGGKRAAVLVLLSSEDQLPLATLAKLSSDGYRTVVHFFEGDDHSNELTLQVRVTEALCNLGCNSVTRSDIANLQSDVACQIRIWRPAVVIGPDAESGSEIDKQVAQAIEAAVGHPDDAKLAHLSEQLALPPWQVSRVFAIARGESRGTHRVEYTGAVPGTGQTLAEAATAARSLFAADYTAPPETDEFQLRASIAGELSTVDDLAAGLEIAHGSDCRRPQPTALPFDAQVARRLAEKRRNLTNIFRFAEGNPALLAQVGQMTSDLDDKAAAALLFELAAQFRYTNQTQLAAETLNLLARRFPDESITDQALSWLVQFYASGETAHAYHDVVNNIGEPPGLSRRNDRGDKPPGSQSIVPATALVEENAAALTQQRYTHAVQLVEHIAQTRPLLYTEPQLRVPWAVAQRHGDSPDASERYLASLAIRYPGEAWQECGAMEQWLADRTRPQPAKPRMNCRFTVDRPTLDGVLDDKCWREFQSLATSAKRLRDTKSEITFTYDEQYLYIGVRCEKIAEILYATDNRPRTYDAELSEHDRVRVLIDVDRDYTTYFSLAVDHRGWTNDSCWGDSSWNPKWFVAAGGDAVHWTAEAAIPWSELVAAPPTTGDAWAVSCERISPGDAAGAGHERVDPRDFSVLLLK